MTIEKYALGALVIALVLGYVLLRIRRKRLERLDERKWDIPDYVNDWFHPSNCLPGKSKEDWVEIHPFATRKRDAKG